MNRRSFLGACLALGVAPAIVRADSLMRVVPREAVVVPAGAIMFDGVSDYLRDGPGVYGEPVTVYMLSKWVDLSGNGRVLVSRIDRMPTATRGRNGFTVGSEFPGRGPVLLDHLVGY